MDSPLPSQTIALNAITEYRKINIEKKLSYGDLEQLVICQIYKALYYKNQNEELHTQNQIQNDELHRQYRGMIETWKKEASKLLKQLTDLQKVHNEVLTELRIKKEGDKLVTPIKIVRSVGVQVGSSINMINGVVASKRQMEHPNTTDSQATKKVCTTNNAPSEESSIKKVKTPKTQKSLSKTQLISEVTASGTARSKVALSTSTNIAPFVLPFIIRTPAMINGTVESEINTTITASKTGTNTVSMESGRKSDLGLSLSTLKLTEEVDKKSPILTKKARVIPAPPKTVTTAGIANLDQELMSKPTTTVPSAITDSKIKTNVLTESTGKSDPRLKTPEIIYMRYDEVYPPKPKVQKLMPKPKSNTEDSKQLQQATLINSEGGTPTTEDSAEGLKRLAG